MNILVVDDEPVIVQGIVKRIQKMKDIRACVVGAYSGNEALEIMNHFFPDLLITDILMPQIDGLTLISRVREKNICEKCIILTAYENFDYAKRAIKLQAIDYLVKPVDWTILESYIRELAMRPAIQADINSILGRYSHIFAELERTDVSFTLKKIIKYIKANYCREISLTHLSIYTGMSENYICNVFKKELNITFLDYVYKLRLKKAIEILLSDPKKSMKDISSMLGYRSERQFFRLFKNKLDMTPQQFRDIYTH